MDWPQILEDIAHVLGEPSQGGRGRVRADYLQVSRSTLLRWQDGSEPRHSDGELLLLAWCRLTGKAQAVAPRKRPTLSEAQMR